MPAIESHSTRRSHTQQSHTQQADTGRDAPPRRPYVRTGHVTIRVLDLDRAIAFYCGVLGLHLRLRVGDQRCEVETSGLTLCLDRAAADLLAPERSSISLEVADLSAMLVDIERSGTPTQRSDDTGRAVLTAVVADPDGNRLFLCEIVNGPSLYIVS